MVGQAMGPQSLVKGIVLHGALWTFRKATEVESSEMSFTAVPRNPIVNTA